MSLRQVHMLDARQFPLDEAADDVCGLTTKTHRMLSPVVT
jgi:hypothetical protein